MKNNYRNWVLVRGLVRGNIHWDHFVRHLQEAFPNDKIHLYELPGNGHRNKEVSPIQTNDYIKDFDQFIFDLSNVYVIAVSLGAMVTLTYLSQKSDRIEQLFVINTSFADSGAFYERFKARNYLTVLKSLRASTYEIEEAILKMTVHAIKERERVLPIFTHEAELFPLSIANFFRQLLAASRMTSPRLSEFSKKIFVFYSRNDKLVSSKNSKQLMMKYNLKGIEHSWGGHDLALDDPHFICDQILKVIQP